MCFNLIILHGMATMQSKRMREYLWQLTHSPMLHTSVLPLGDGAAVSVKTGEQVYETTRTIGSGEQP